MHMGSRMWLLKCGTKKQKMQKLIQHMKSLAQMWKDKAKKEELDPTHEKLKCMTMIHTYEEGKRMMVMVSMRMMVWNWMVM